MTEPRSPLYPEAVEFTKTRKTFSRARFQRVLRVGFVTRDSLLLQLEDAGVVKRIGVDLFEVTA